MVLRIPTTSIRYRREFNLANKSADETLENWYDRLKVLAQQCDYGTYSEAFILNQFICGLDALILEYFHMEQQHLSLNDVFELTKSFKHSDELVDVKQVLVSIKTEELNLSDDEHYNNDNTFGDSDEDEQGTANETRPMNVNDEPIEKNGPNEDARKDKVGVPIMAVRRSFQCYLCRKTFKTTGNLVYHFTCCHTIGKHSKASKSTVKRTIDPPELPTSFECYLCHKVMPTAGNLVYHYAVHHTIGKTSKCVLCGKWVNDSSNMVRHLNLHFQMKAFRCTMCDAEFSSNSLLKKHLRAHSKPNVKEFKCSKCPKVFITKVHFETHSKEHKRPKLSLSERFDNLLKKKKEQKTNDGKYKCDICATPFNKESELMVHSKVHSVNEFLCHLCGSKLLSKRNLMVHYRVHANEKPYQCEECGRTFTTKSKCNRHVKTHDGTLARPHKCTICAKMFIQRCHLAEHMKVHNPVNTRFKCDECPKDFFKEDQLARHKLDNSFVLQIQPSMIYLFIHSTHL